MDLCNLLDSSGLIHAAEASSALATGWVASPPSPGVSLSEIARIYSLRHEHLLSLPSAYAAELATSIGELLARLGTSPAIVANWLTIRGDAEHHFLVLISDTQQVIGCLRVSQLETTGVR